MTDPTAVFAQRDVQSVMQAALNDPIAPFETEKAGRIQLWEGEAADEINDFGRLLAFAPDAPPQPRDGLGAGKARLGGSHFLAIQDADFMSPPVDLPA